MKSMKSYYNLDPLIHMPDKMAYDERFIEQIFKFIEQNIEPPFSISVNGPWGSGKTLFMKKLEKLFQENGYPVLWFNPWEYERADDVVFCFLIELSRFAKSQLKELAKKLGFFSIAFLASSLDLTARLITNNALSYSNIEKIHDSLAKVYGERYDEENSVEVIKHDFCEMTSELAKKHNQKPFLIFLDDLDRCLPDKALDLIEAMKNIFVVPGARVVFISGIDTQVTKQFIISRYQGLHENFATNYFKKIFNFTIDIPLLPELTLKALVKNRFDELKIDESNEIINYFKLEDKFINLFCSTITTAGLMSIRNIYNILGYLNYIFTINSISCKYYSILVVLITIKEIYPDFFEETFNKKANESPNKYLNELFDLEDFEKTDHFKHRLLKKLNAVISEFAEEETILNNRLAKKFNYHKYSESSLRASVLIEILSVNLDSFGQKLKRLREEHGISLKECAHHLRAKANYTIEQTIYEYLEMNFLKMSSAEQNQLYKALSRI